VIGLAAFAVWLGVAAPEDPTVRAILQDDRFAFCHEPSYPLTEEEAGWCPILAAHGAPMCPAFPQTCAAPRAQLQGAPGRFATRKELENEEPVRGDGDGPQRGSEPRAESEVRLPDLGGLAQVLFWGIIIAGIVAIVVAIARHAIGTRHASPEPEPTTPGPVDDAAAVAAPRSRLPADIETLLRAAEDAERRGDFVLAVDYGHAALLRRLDHEGVIRLHRSRTTGDYLSDLREHPDWRGPAAPVLRDIDRAQFRASGPDAPLTRSIVARVLELARRAASTTALVLVVSIVLACSGFGRDRSYPWGTSPSGTDGIVELLKNDGRTVKWRIAELAALEHGGTIVLLAGAQPKDAEWAVLRDWVGTQGGTLVIADGGVWPEWIGAQSSGDPHAAIAPDADAEPGGHVPGDTRLTLSDDRWTVRLERDHGPYAAERELGFGAIVVLADDHLFTNAALAVGHTQALELVGIVGDIELVDGWTGEGASSPMESIERSHLTAAMAQLLLLVLALLLWRGWPFGRGRDPAPPPRRGFSDHARAMGLHYASARASAHAASAYASWALETLRQSGALHGGGLHGLAQTVAQRTGRDETEVMRMLVEAHGAAESGTSGSTEDLQLLRELVRLVREGGGRR